jgi:predicted thioesterase
MKDIFKAGDTKAYCYVVKEDDKASFHGEVVHPVMATYALAREVEWSTRLFVLEMRDDDEEGVGTFLSINHRSPAFVGEEIMINAQVDSINHHELICSYKITVGDRLIAEGKTGQKILKRERIKGVFSKV